LSPRVRQYLANVHEKALISAGEANARPSLDTPGKGLRLRHDIHDPANSCRLHASRRGDRESELRAARGRMGHAYEGASMAEAPGASALVAGELREEHAQVH